MRKTALVFVIISFFTAILVLPVFAADHGKVTATVTPKLISISLSETSVDYGIVNLSGSATSGVITATNNGNVAEDFEVSGSTATAGGYLWNLTSNPPGANEFRHSFALDPYSSFTPLQPTRISFDSNVVASGARDFKLKIEMPASISGPYEQYTTAVTVVATESS